LLARLQLEIPSQGQCPQSSEHSGAGGRGEVAEPRATPGVLASLAASQHFLPIVPRFSSALWVVWAEHPTGRRELLAIGKQREA